MKASLLLFGVRSQWGFRAFYIPFTATLAIPSTVVALLAEAGLIAGTPLLAFFLMEKRSPEGGKPATAEEEQARMRTLLGQLNLACAGLAIFLLLLPHLLSPVVLLLKLLLVAGVGLVVLLLILREKQK